MSDLQELIHTNAHNAFEIGVRTEQERITKRIKEELSEMLRQHGLVIIPEVFDYFIEQIKQDKMSDPSDKLETPNE